MAASQFLTSPEHSCSSRARARIASADPRFASDQVTRRIDTRNCAALNLDFPAGRFTSLDSRRSIGRSRWSVDKPGATVPYDLGNEFIRTPSRAE